MTDDHLPSWYLAYTCGLFVLVCSPIDSSMLAHG